MIKFRNFVLPNRRQWFYCCNMAKQTVQDTEVQFDNLVKDIEKKRFSPLYLLMGEEPYYNDVIVQKLIDNVLEPHERDFNQTIVYASDTNAGNIVSLARRFPVFAPRQLIVVKEAQQLSKLEPLEIYLQAPAQETVLVLVYTGKSVDKRSAFYKRAKECGCIFESALLPEWKVPQWIISYVEGMGRRIVPDAAALMAEHAGNSLRKIVLELDKVIKSLDEGSDEITVRDIELNVGISREFSAFELCKSLAMRNCDKAFKIAHHFGENPKMYPLTMTLGAMFFYFAKVLKAYAFYRQEKLSPESAVRKAGAFGYQEKEYIAAMRNYSFPKVMGIIALIREYDYKQKSGEAGTASDGDLLLELISKIFN